MSQILRSPLVGVVPLALLGGWALFVHPAAPGSTSWAVSCAVVAGGLLAGVALGRVQPVVPGLLALAVAVGAVVLSAPESLSGNPLAPPLGYMNANGAMLVAGAGGAVVAAETRPRSWQLGASVIALLLAWVCLAEGAQTAAVACLLVAVWGLLRDLGPTEVWLGAGALVVALPPFLSVAWASGAWAPPGAVVSVLSEERLDLWSEAWGLLGDHPVRGVGPGRFSQESPTAADPDLAWAHSALLQTGAELGWVGVVLLLLVLAWAVVALGRDAILLGALLLPASVDYVLHFGAVLLLSSLVLGAAVDSGGRGLRLRG
ncbi:O-antigen ligase family protein [Nocardioides sp. GXQ0305]|uniref:O-antigen ligase family protein n=1 Tax=Nocardioides sp. GXQ0305 TaxID=3423912 RepID=UPI003D7EF13C